MSGLHSLSIETSAPLSDPGSMRGPRPADLVDPPVASPVHGLQEQLRRLDIELPAIGDEKVPGWLRLGVPLALSSALWAGILWVAGALRGAGLTE